MMTKIYKTVCVLLCGVVLTGCSDFLEDQVPQATLTQDEVKNPAYIDNVLISAYAGLLSIEDMNSSFSLWNYDTRSDDAYVGGADFSDGEPFHILEKHGHNRERMRVTYHKVEPVPVILHIVPGDFTVHILTGCGKACEAAHIVQETEIIGLNLLEQTAFVRALNGIRAQGVRYHGDLIALLQKQGCDAVVPVIEVYELRLVLCHVKGIAELAIFAGADSIQNLVAGNLHEFNHNGRT